MKTEILRVFKIVLLFISLFVINIIFFKIISLLGFSITMTDLSFLVPPLFATIALLLINKYKKLSNYLICIVFLD
ncbi:hypothetical protein [Ezakiella coagulans]|uniref:hypothetical protein n=1 Tax=Ezakiella coagulans TaxID=46507 RepID=UPI00288AE1BE|nr:hypothetical protein [Ezakiella coagulans]